MQGFCNSDCGLARRRVVAPALVALLMGGVSLAAPPGRSVDRQVKFDQRVKEMKAFGVCVVDCSTEDCLRTCIATATATDARSPTKAGVTDCLVDGLGDVGTCAEAFLGADPDAEGFWVCVGGAIDLFARCAKKVLRVAGSPTDLEMKQTLFEQERTLFEHRILLGAVAKIWHEAFLSDGPLEVQPIAIDRPAPRAVLQDTAPPTFGKCVNDLVADRKTCSDAFPEDTQGQGVCNDGATSLFKRCLVQVVR